MVCYDLNVHCDGRVSNFGFETLILPRHMFDIDFFQIRCHPNQQLLCLSRVSKEVWQLVWRGNWLSGLWTVADRSDDGFHGGCHLWSVFPIF